MKLPLDTANLPKQITFEDQRFYKSVITKEGIFYCNYREGDENANTIMFDHNGGLLSNNYFAYSALFGSILDNSIQWASRTARYGIRAQQEQL